MRLLLALSWFCATEIHRGESRSDDETRFRVLTLAEAETLAHANQPAVKAALAEVVEAERQAQRPIAKWLPRADAGLELAGTTVNNTTASLLPVAGIDVSRISATAAVRQAETKPYPSTLAALAIRQTLFDFGKYEVEHGAAIAREEEAKAHATLSDCDARFAVDEAYYSVLAAKAILRAAEEALARATIYRDLAAAGVENGLRPPIELTRTEADLERISAERIRASGGLEKARLLLAATIGQPAAAVDTRNEPAPAFAAPTLDDGLSYARLHAPEWLQADWAVEVAHRRRQAVWSSYRPELSFEGVFFSYAGGIAPSSGPEPQGNGWLPSVANYALGVTLHIPLFDFTLITEARIAAAQEGTAQFEHEAASQQQETRIRDAYVDRRVAEAALPSLERAVKAAQANWQQANARFSGGIGTSVELADAEATREGAEVELALGQFALARAAAVQRRVLGEQQ